MTYTSGCVEPEEQSAHGKGLKVHLREVAVAGYSYRIVTLRPATTARFSTNRFHDTWHILTDREGAFVLARLLWGLSFQRMAGTAVLIDGAHLVPTPFDAERADPILLVPAGLTRVDADRLGLLRKSLRRPAQGTTIRWHTFGLPRAFAGGIDFRSFRYREAREQSAQERAEKLGGFVCYSAPPAILRAQALAIYGMRECESMTYRYLAEASDRAGWHPNAEVQVFREFRDMVSVATVARRCVVGTQARIRTHVERQAVYEQAALVGERMRSARRRQKDGRA